MTHPFFSESFMVMAHRGDSANYPENTLPAFLGAQEAGADCIETDVHLTKDGHIVVWHDASVLDNTGRSVSIASCTLEELQEFDAGLTFSADGGQTYPFRGKGIRMIPFERALQELPEMKFNVDLKPRDPALAQVFADCLVKHQVLDRVLCASFHGSNLRMFRHLLPDAATSCSRREAMGMFLLARSAILFMKKRIPALAIQIPPMVGAVKTVSPRLIRRYQQAGLYVHVWTVNDRNTMEKLISWGVDGIFTDIPSLLVEVLGRKNP